MNEDLVKATLMGVVEGLTEFIPVSSTGHLILFGNAIEFDGAGSASFEIFIQLGAILAVVCLYPKRFLGLIPTGASPGQGLAGWSGLLKIGAACLPAFIAGFLFYGAIRTYLFNPITVSLGLIVGGIIMILIERGERSVTARDLDSVSLRQSFLIGIFQCFALWPGVSRSGATIIGAMLVGLERKVAAEFSFLVAVPVMFAAVLYDLYKSGTAIPPEMYLTFGVGFLVSFITAILAIRFFLGMLAKFSLAPFGYYRVVLGAFVLVILGYSL